MTYAPRNRRHRNNTHDGNGGSADEPDAERIRRQLRAEIRAAARDRLCEPDDVFGTDDGDMIGARAGDKASWQEWQIGEGTQEQAHVSDDYRAAMRALSYKVCAKAGKKAWRILVQQAMQATGPQGDSLRREIRHWLESRHYGHDPSFDEELRRSAIYITDRKVLFNLVEAAHYKLAAVNKTEKATAKADADGDRTISLIDNFLDSIPADQEEDKATKRKPTPADATIDYVSYLLETESEGDGDSQQSPQLKGHDLIDNFIFNEGGKIQLKEEPEYLPDIDESNEDDRGCS